MIHPHTEIRKINDLMGYGVFATKFIPKGTIVYVKDLLEIEVFPEQYFQFDEPYKSIVDKYSYIDQRGVRIISWDIAKYVNHRCDCNTISTGYGFEIAIRDIQPDEEVTDEYGLFNIETDMLVECNCLNCRKIVTARDIDLFAEQWDQLIISAMPHILLVDQPLWQLLEDQTQQNLFEFVSSGKGYISVTHLKYTPALCLV